MSEAEEPLVARLFAKLADGQFHSGETLAAGLAVSRSAVWKAARALRELGATVHAVRNRGYRLALAAEPLDGGKIRALLDEAARAGVAGPGSRLPVAPSVCRSVGCLAKCPAIWAPSGWLSAFVHCGR